MAALDDIDDEALVADQVPSADAMLGGPIDEAENGPVTVEEQPPAQEQPAGNVAPLEDAALREQQPPIRAATC